MKAFFWLLSKTVLPLLTNMWWYPTSYALFLLLLPFISHSLQKIGYRNHKALAICVLLLWGALAMVPFPVMQLDLSKIVYLFSFTGLFFCRTVNGI